METSKELVGIDEHALRRADEVVNAYFSGSGPSSAIEHLGSNNSEIVAVVAFFADAKVEELKNGSYSEDQTLRGIEAVQTLRELTSTVVVVENDDPFLPAEESVKPKYSAAANLGKIGVSTIGDIDTLIDTIVDSDRSPATMLKLMRAGFTSQEVEAFGEILETANIAHSTNRMKNALLYIRRNGINLSQDSDVQMLLAALEGDSQDNFDSVEL